MCVCFCFVQLHNNGTRRKTAPLNSGQGHGVSRDASGDQQEVLVSYTVLHNARSWRCEKTGLPSFVPPNPMVKFIISLWKIERIGHSLHKLAKTHPDLGIGSRHLGIAPAQMLWLVSGRLVDSANSCSQLPGEDSYSYWKSPQSQIDLLIWKLEAPLFKTGKNKIPAWSGTW